MYRIRAYQRLCIEYIVVCIVQCTLYSVHCTLYSVQCTVYSVQFTVYIVQCTVSVYFIQFTYSIRCIRMNVAQCHTDTDSRTV